MAERKTYEEVVSELSSVSYNSSIAYYNNLKKSFLSKYTKNMENGFKDFQKKFNEELFSSEASSIIQTMEDQSKELLEDVRGIILGEQRDNATKVRDLKRRAEKLKGEAKKDYEKAVEENLKVVQPTILEQMKQFGVSEEAGINTNDLLNSLQSYYKKALLTRSNASYKYYIQSIKGYLYEVKACEAFVQLYGKIDGKVPTLNVLHTGSIKIDKKDSIYDIFVGAMNNIEEEFKKISTITAEEIIPKDVSAFGIQVKSWTPPWKANPSYWQSSKGYSISHQAQLLGLLNSISYETFSWVDGVKFLENHLTTGLGPLQVAYVAGDSGFIWTSELIARFRSLNYYYAFVFDSKHKATNSTSWQQIQKN